MADFSDWIDKGSEQWGFSSVISWIYRAIPTTDLFAILNNVVLVAHEMKWVGV